MSFQRVLSLLPNQLDFKSKYYYCQEEYLKSLCRYKTRVSYVRYKKNTGTSVIMTIVK